MNRHDAAAILDHVPVPVLVIDAATQAISLANAAWLRCARTTDDLHEDLRRELATVIETGLRSALEGIELGGHDWRAVLQPIEADGKVTSVVIAYENCDTERELRSALARKDHFIVRSAHEMRAPLQALLLWQKLLRTQVAVAADRDQALAAIVNSATAMSQMLGNLVDMSRAITGDLQLDLEPVALDPLIGEILMRARPRAAANNIELVEQLVAPLGTVHSNAHRLNQAIEVVLDHVLRHALPNPASAAVTFDAHREDAVVVLAVTSTGKGLSPERVDHVFEPFSYVDDPASPGDASLGLGLALARTIIELLDGTLTAHSAGVRDGVTFTFRLRAQA